MFKILIPIGCRSDEGLSKPIIDKLKADEAFECVAFQLIAPEFIESYQESMDEIRLVEPDLVICVGDRVEMFAAAIAAFHAETPIAHVYAGCKRDNESSTFDEIHRHQITLMSEIQFCESEEAGDLTEELIKSIKQMPNYHIVGITHMDNVDIDESLVPLEPYNLILINKTTLIREMPVKFLNGNNIIIGSNPDGILADLKPDYDNLPREQYLGLLKNCTLFITNSSSEFYEAPFLIKKEQIIHIGERNSAGEFKQLQIGASDKIVEKIRELYLK